MKKTLVLAIVLLTSSAYADWEYGNWTDKMTDKQFPWASIESKDSLNLGFPYAGSNYGNIYVRQTPKGALNVMVSVQKGQILCHSYTSCHITVRFDDGKPIQFSGAEPADNSSNKIFLEPESKFVAEAKKAKRILVALTMYQSGQQMLEFQSAQPLQWGPSAPSKPAAKK